MGKSSLRAILLSVVVSAGCEPPSNGADAWSRFATGECSIDRQAGALFDQTRVDCGFETAQACNRPIADAGFDVQTRCFADALGADASVRLRWSVEDCGETRSFAFVAGGGLVARHYVETTGSDGLTRVEAFTCRDIIANRACAPTSGGPCIQCQMEAAPSSSCAE